MKTTNQLEEDKRTAKYPICNKTVHSLVQQALRQKINFQIELPFSLLAVKLIKIELTPVSKIRRHNDASL